MSHDPPEFHTGGTVTGDELAVIQQDYVVPRSWFPELDRGRETGGVHVVLVIERPARVEEVSVTVKIDPRAGKRPRVNR